MADIATFMVRSPDGRTVPLLSMVDVSINPAATEVERTNRQTTLTIKASLAKDATMPDARKAMEDAIQAFAFPAGSSYSFDGGALQDEAARQTTRLNSSPY